MARALVAIFALIIVAAGGVYGLEAALQTAGDDRTITRESFTPDPDVVIELDNSNRDNVYYDRQVAVFNNSDVRMVEGVDYIWFHENGTIKPLSGGNLASDVNGEITYNFSVPTESQRGLTSILGLLPQVIGLVIPAFVVVIALAFLRG